MSTLGNIWFLMYYYYILKILLLVLFLWWFMLKVWGLMLEKWRLVFRVRLPFRSIHYFLLSILIVGMCLQIWNQWFFLNSTFFYSFDLCLVCLRTCLIICLICIMFENCVLLYLWSLFDQWLVFFDMLDNKIYLPICSSIDSILFNCLISFKHVKQTKDLLREVSISFLLSYLL